MSRCAKSQSICKHFAQLTLTVMSSTYSTGEWKSMKSQLFCNYFAQLNLTVMSSTYSPSTGEWKSMVRRLLPSDAFLKRKPSKGKL